MNEDIVHLNNDMLTKVVLMNVNQDKNKLEKVNQKEVLLNQFDDRLQFFLLVFQQFSKK
jgi:hypothetical protein